ncbi:MAG: helix-turn-helix domain-containing protein [Acidimicrobiales bacterium]
MQASTGGTPAMLTQEEFVHRVLELKRQGWSVTEIAAEMGYHPATVSKWLKQGGPPPARRVDPSMRAIGERWAKGIGASVSRRQRAGRSKWMASLGSDGLEELAGP